MKKGLKTIAALTSLCFVGAPFANAFTVDAETVTPDKYYVEINNTAVGGSPEYFGNKLPLTKGENMTLTYTVEGVESYAQDSYAHRHLNVVSATSTASKIYPQASATIGVSPLLATSGENYNNYKNLEDTGYFDVNGQYTVTFTAQGAGDTYNWSVKKGESVLKSSTIVYHEYFLISFYFYSFTLTLDDVSAWTDSADLGVNVWDNGQPTDNALLVNMSTVSGGTDMTTENVIAAAEEADLAVEEGVYYGKDGVKITPKKDEATVYLSLPSMSDFNAGEKAHVTFKLKVAGDTGTYDDFRLYTWGDTLVDYAYPKNSWNFVNFDAPVFERDGKKIVELKFTKVNGETIYIANAEASDDLFDTSNLFKGMELYQIEAKNSLNMSYVCITPSGKVIVIDGGYDKDAANLYSLVKQYTTHVDAWYISHFHSDHAKAVIEMINNYDIVIENLYADYRDEAGGLNGFLDSEVTNLIAAFEEALAANPSKVKKFTQTKQKDVHDYGDGIKMTILNDADFTAEGNYGNESNVCFKLVTPGEDILFLGDLGPYGDQYLADEWFVSEMRTCRVIQMAHHGQNGVTNLFYETIDDIKVCLYPALEWVYDASNGTGLGSASNLTTLKTRNLMRELGVRAIYTNAFGRIKLR